MAPVAKADTTIAMVRDQMMVEWFKVDKTVSYVALVVGLFIIIIAYFAGGKENKAKLIFSIISATLIGILSMPLFIKFGRWLGIFGHQWGEIFLLSLFIVYVTALSCHAYEIVTVSAKEARPD
jgi:hypothetical protein